jgi:hypothetical protein
MDDILEIPVVALTGLIVLLVDCNLVKVPAHISDGVWWWDYRVTLNSLADDGSANRIVEPLKTLSYKSDLVK